MEVMEPQLESQLPEKHVLVERADQEDEEEEPGVGLVARQSKNPSNGGVKTIPTSTFTTSDGPEPGPQPQLRPAEETTSDTEHSEEEEKGEEAENSLGKEELGYVNGEDKAVEVDGDASGNSVYFDKLQGSESINGVFEAQPEIPKGLSTEINHQRVEAPVEHLHEETDTSFEHFENATKLDANVDSVGEIEEDLLDLDVERVVKKQNTHDLYCPNCRSCITRTVILRRRTKISNIRPKSKRQKKLDPIPAPVAAGLGGDLPEINSNVTPTITAVPATTSAPAAQDTEALHCLSCFSLFIPIGNGCLKFFQIFKSGKQSETQDISQGDNRQSLLETSPMENTQSSTEIDSSENVQSPPEISQNATSPEAISQNEYTESPQKVSHGEDTQSPSKISSDEAKRYPQKGSTDDNKHNLQQIRQNGDAQKQNESKQSPQEIPAAFLGFHKDKETVQKEDAAVPKVSGSNGDHVDVAIMKLEVPGISNIISPTDLPNKLKAEPRGWKIDASMFEKTDGENEIKDLEAGLLEPSFPPRTDVESSSQIITQNEGRAAVAGEAHEWEILKSIVYGGLIESITSLGIVASAAGAGADTLNVLALGLANLFGGLLFIIHNLRELKKDQPRGTSSETNVEEYRYQVLLGQRQNFILHATVAIISYIIFGLVPPVVYGFSFRKSDDKDLKLAAVAGASLVCIFLLALGKGHVRKPHRAYFRTVSYYVGLGITASGISYLVGVLIKRLLEQLGLFQSSSVVSDMPFLGTIPFEAGRASY